MAYRQNAPRCDSLNPHSWIPQYNLRDNITHKAIIPMGPGVGWTLDTQYWDTQALRCKLSLNSYSSTWMEAPGASGKLYICYTVRGLFEWVKPWCRWSLYKGMPRINHHWNTDMRVVSLHSESGKEWVYYWRHQVVVSSTIWDKQCFSAEIGKFIFFYKTLS